MGDGLLKRTLISVAVVSLFLVMVNILFYKYIPESIPVIRGVFIQKTIFMATRILIINIITIGMCSWLIKILIRNGKGSEIEIPGTILLIVVILKAIIEEAGMFFKQIMDGSLYILVPIVVVGILCICLKGRSLFKKEFWKTVKTQKSDAWRAAGLIMLYLILNIPVILVINKK